MNTNDSINVQTLHAAVSMRSGLLRRMIKRFAPAITLTALLGVMTTSVAAPPYQPDFVTGGNMWSFKAYDDASPDHTQLVAAQEICFEYAGISGNHQMYTWYSQTFPGWRGRAVQEGDQIFIHGDFAEGAGHSSIQMDTLVAPTINGSAGTWQEWRHDRTSGTTVNFAKTRALRQGDCTMSAKEAAALKPLLRGNPVVTNVAP